MTSIFDYIDAIHAELDQETVDRDDLMRLLGEETGGYLDLVEFLPAHEAFSHGELLLYHPNRAPSAVRLTVRAPITPEMFIERFGPTRRGATTNIDTQYSMQWLVGKRRPDLFNRTIIHVSWEGLVQQVSLTRDHE
jgi:hypothetical protein